jgi:hypothetical protein
LRGRLCAGVNPFPDHRNLFRLELLPFARRHDLFLPFNFEALDELHKQALAAFPRHNRGAVFAAFHQSVESLQDQVAFRFVAGMALDATLHEDRIDCRIIVGRRGRAEREHKERGKYRGKLCG